MIIDEKQRKLIHQTTKVICNYFDLPIVDVLAKSRKAEFVKARQIAQKLCYSLIKKISLSNVGFEIGRKDHATVRHSINTVNNLCDTDKQYKQDYDNIMLILTSSLFPDGQALAIRKRLKRSRELRGRRSASIRHNIKYELNYI